MTTNLQTSHSPSPDMLIRLSGLAAIGAGLIFAGIQPVHPADVLDSVTTLPWTIILSLKFGMCLLMLAGITGIYLRQVGKLGWLGFAGFAMLATTWFLQSGFIFAELFMVPKLAMIAPDYADSLLTLARGGPASVDISVMSTTYSIAGVLYLLGGVVFGIATFRANVLPRWAALLWVATAVVTPFAVLVPHAIQRYAAIPMGITLIWLGIALWTERRSIVPALAGAATQLREAVAN